MPKETRVLKTRKITEKEAEICAREEVQYIGTVQPHGFVLVIDSENYNIVQHSENFIRLLTKRCSKEFNKKLPVLGTSLSDWMVFSKEEIADSVSTKSTKLLSFQEGGYISPVYWECLVNKSGDFFCLDFIPGNISANNVNSLSVLDKVIAKLKTVETIAEVYQVITDQFQKFTGYDRVMFYKFHSDWSGDVMAESVSDNTEIQYLGLRFPAEDIPKKARELYLTSSLRVMANVDAVPVSLVPSLLPNGEPLDQGQSTLRGMSHFHVQYLKNMGVKASLSLGLVKDDKLWGLLAFHHNTPRVPPLLLVSQMKASCEILAEIIMSYLRPKDDLEKLEFEMHCQQFTYELFKSVRLSSTNLTSLGVCLETFRQEVHKKYVGVIFENQLYFAAEKSLRSKKRFMNNVESLLHNRNFFESSSLLADIEPTILSLEVDFAGLLAIRGNNLSDLLVFFALEEQEKEVVWGGVPREVNIVRKNGENYLEPRSSFVAWKEKVKGHSVSWTDSDRKLLRSLQSSIESCILYYESEDFKHKLLEVSYHDDLTNLASRHYLKEYVERLAIANKNRYGITVIFLDLDNFKKINDYLGHTVGDGVLLETAKRLEKCMGTKDLISRFGGDEFLIIIQHESLDSALNYVQAQTVTERIIHALSEPIVIENKSMLVTPSIGVLICKPEEIVFDEVLRKADIAMYYAKNAGKNQVHFFDKADNDKVELEGFLEQELRLSIENKSIEVFFQPQFNANGVLVGAEALARWKVAGIGNIAPDKFIALAEKNNLIVELGELIFESSCKEFLGWKNKHLVAQDFILSINISAIQIFVSKFEKRALKLIDRYGLSANKVCFEITESIFMDNFEDATNLLNKLRSNGFLISLDDFGTGYSSLSYLLKLPIDQVKIDRSFVKKIHINNEMQSIVEAIIELCNKMSFTIVAEGVESRKQYNLLKKLGCNIFQGFLFGRPVAADKFEQKYL